METFKRCEVCGERTKANRDEAETLCLACLNDELTEARELALEALARPVQIAGYVPPRRFGDGPGEIPSIAIRSALSESERETVGGMRIVAGFVLGALALAAAGVAWGAGVWIRAGL